MDEKATKLLAPIEQLLERLSVDAVFGKPAREGDTTVIPVADVALGFGYGYGEGPARPEDADEHGGSEDSEGVVGTSGGGGGGGGGGGHASPRGFLRISPDGVSYEPIMDQGRIALAGIAMSAWAVFWVTRTIRAFAPVCRCRCEGECDCEDDCDCTGDGDAE